MRQAIALDQRMPTGETQREALESVEAQTGRRPKELDVPEVPPACQRVMEIFQNISAGRIYTMSGPAPLSNVDIFAWCQLTGSRLENWELRAIRAFDQVWLKAYIEEQKRTAPPTIAAAP